MAEYKEISSGLKMLLSKAEEMGWKTGKQMAKLLGARTA